MRRINAIVASCWIYFTIKGILVDRLLGHSVCFGCHGLTAHKEETIVFKRKNLSEALKLEQCTENVRLLGDNTMPQGKGAELVVECGSI